MSQESQDQEHKALVIFFGPNEGSKEEVDNVKVNFVGEHDVASVIAGEPDLDFRKKFRNIFDELIILKSCEEIYLLCRFDGKDIGEMYIPMHRISGITVDFKIEEKDKSD